MGQTKDVRTAAWEVENVCEASFNANHEDVSRRLPSCTFISVFEWTQVLRELFCFSLLVFCSFTNRCCSVLSDFIYIVNILRPRTLTSALSIFAVLAHVLRQQDLVRSDG